MGFLRSAVEYSHQKQGAVDFNTELELEDEEDRSARLREPLPPQAEPNSPSQSSTNTDGATVSPATRKRRASARKQILEQAGTAKQAFKQLDLNGNKFISRSEFSAGMKCLGSSKEIERSFHALDLNEDGVIDMMELFPKGQENARLSTPDFWGAYCRQGDRHVKELEGGDRIAKWLAEDPDAEVTRMLKRVADQDESASERRRMKMWIRHLKAEGSSDEMIRRLCAAHLPKVPRFTKEHAHKLRVRYNAKVTDSVRKVQEGVKDMRELRHSVQKFKESLTEVVEPKCRVRRQSGMDVFGDMDASATIQEEKPEELSVEPEPLDDSNFEGLRSHYENSASRVHARSVLD